MKALLRYLCWMLAFQSVPLLAQTNLVVLAEDGAWTWYNDPRALFHNGALYFGYVRNRDGKSVLSALELQSGRCRELWSSELAQKDDHNNPALLVKEDGRLLAIHARHNSDQFFSYRLSTTTNPVTPSAWSQEFTNHTGAGVTYANPFQLSAESGRIYNFTRNQNFNPTVLTSTNGGQDWSSPQLFIRTGTGSVRPYVKYCSDYRERIDFLYTDGHPRNLTNSLYHLFYRSNHFYKTDGFPLKSYSALPILHDAGERGSIIYQYSDLPSEDPNEHIPTGRAWCAELVYTTNGAPVALFTVQCDKVTGPNWTDDRIYYYYARWTGTNWHKRFIAHAGRPLYEPEDDYPGGICADPENPNIIYISSNALNPFDLTTITNVPLRANNRYELYKGVTTNGGLSFTWEPITTNSTVDNLRPFIPRDHNGAPAVIWFRGAYSTFTSYQCEVVGLFSQPIPRSPKARIISPSRSLVAFTNLDNELTLSASVIDDDQPVSASILWTTAQGPTNAIFSEPTNKITSVHFPAPGEYTLRVTADDTLGMHSADTVVVAGPNSGNANALDSVLWFKCDEGSGNTLLDHSGASNNGTALGNTTWLPNGGVRGGAIQLNAPSAEIVVPDADSLDQCSAFTLAFWFLAKKYPGDSGGLVCKRNNVGDNNAYTTYLKTADRRIYVDIDGANNRFASTALLNTNEWYHIALVFDGSSQASERARLWINGELDVTSNETSSVIPNYTSSFRIGNTHPGATNWLEGAFDEVQFFRRALSPAEIRALAVRHRTPSIVMAPPPNAISGAPAIISAQIDPGTEGSLRAEWNVDDAAGVRFEQSGAATTTVRFPRAGSYLLELRTATDLAEVSDHLPVWVGSNTNVFEDWADAFLHNQPVALRDAAADPDQDGMWNILEFAFGLDPLLADVNGSGSSGWLHVGLIPIEGTNFLAASMRRPVGRLGIEISAKATHDFGTWSEGVAAGTIPLGEGRELITIRDTVAVENAPNRFLKLEVSRIPF